MIGLFGDSMTARFSCIINHQCGIRPEQAMNKGPGEGRVSSTAPAARNPIRRHNVCFAACLLRRSVNEMEVVTESTAPMNFPPRLIDGYSTFAAGRLRTEQARYRELAESGQNPEIMVIGCCDSRVSPEVIFDARPGELFVVRNVANIVPPYAPDGQAHGVSAALEFGVGALRVKHIVVLGHAHCGGVKAFAEDAEPLSPGDFIGKWMKLMAPAAEKVGPRGNRSLADYIKRLEQACVVNSLDNLMTFPRLAKLIEKDKIATHGAYFGVATGDLSVLDKASGTFEPVARANLSIAPRF
jgi:carbonic anhydrase